MPEPANSSYVAISSRKVGHAAKLSENYKFSKWKARAPVGVVVLPLAVETTGHLGSEFRKFLKTIEKATQSSIPASHRARSRVELISQISVTCVKYNSQCVNEAVNGLGALAKYIANTCSRDNDASVLGTAPIYHECRHS